MSHDIEEWCKIWRKTDLLFQKWHQFGEFWPEHSKFTKFLLWLFFCGRYVTCYQKKYRGVIFHGTEEWCKIWRKADLRFGKWRKKYDKFSPEHLKVSNLGLWYDAFIQSRKCMSLTFTEELFCHYNEDWCKIWRGIDLSFQNWHEEFEEFWLEHLKVSNICTLMGSFRPKYIIFELKKYRIVAWWHWTFMQNLKEK